MLSLAMAFRSRPPSIGDVDAQASCVVDACLPRQTQCPAVDARERPSLATVSATLSLHRSSATRNLEARHLLFSVYRSVPERLSSDTNLAVNASMVRHWLLKMTPDTSSQVY
ncbi:hypothetical protein IF1G_00037 [Cordyceps javanica]|uniref:Uncharacterized protein n=1 Tax=Cordyceps javanica TaxID=43265 RepID=A0A545VEH1_9HYPO|nr:hypothetical protein IF1G_00037 [Cordyceps javanica]TQW11305.1 hypothetical protein IF2G_00036 [Cordyceps javanica]